MNKREKFLKEIAEVINRNSLEAHFNDTPGFRNRRRHRRYRRSTGLPHTDIQG